MRTLLERALSPVRNAINVAPLIRRVPSRFLFFFFLSFCFPPLVTRGNDVSGQRREGTGFYTYIYIYSIRSLQFRVSMCSAELDASSNVHPRSKLGKAHDPLDLSNSRETVGKEVLREVYFA